METCPECHKDTITIESVEVYPCVNYYRCSSCRYRIRVDDYKRNQHKDTGCVIL